MFPGCTDRTVLTAHCTVILIVFARCPGMHWATCQSQACLIWIAPFRSLPHCGSKQPHLLRTSLLSASSSIELTDFVRSNPGLPPSALGSCLVLQYCSHCRRFHRGASSRPSPAIMAACTGCDQPCSAMSHEVPSILMVAPANTLNVPASAASPAYQGLARRQVPQALS